MPASAVNLSSQALPPALVLMFTSTSCSQQRTACNFSTMHIPSPGSTLSRWYYGPVWHDLHTVLAQQMLPQSPISLYFFWLSRVRADVDSTLFVCLDSPAKLLMNSSSHLAAGAVQIITRWLPLEYLVITTLHGSLCCFPMSISLQVLLCCRPVLSYFLECTFSASPWPMILHLFIHVLTIFYHLDSSPILSF